jgi:hypothetical protein
VMMNSLYNTAVSNYFGFLVPPGINQNQVRPIFSPFPGSNTGINYLFNPPGFSSYDTALINNHNYLEELISVGTINEINKQVGLPEYFAPTPYQSAWPVPPSYNYQVPNVSPVTQPTPIGQPPASATVPASVSTPWSAGALGVNPIVNGNTTAPAMNNTQQATRINRVV